MRCSELICLLGCMAVLFACKKEKDDEPVTAAVNVLAKEQFAQCNCGIKDSSQFINGIFNGTYMCFNDKSNTTNQYYMDLNYNIDDITIGRRSNDASRSCTLDFIKSDVYYKALPFKLPHPYLNGCERAILSFKNLISPYSKTCDDCTWDDWDYYGSTNSGLTVFVTDTTGGYLKGTFEGKAYTNIGREMDVTNGAFAIHLDTISIIR